MFAFCQLLNIILFFAWLIVAIIPINAAAAVIFSLLSFSDEKYGCKYDFRKNNPKNKIIQ